MTGMTVYELAKSAGARICPADYCQDTLTGELVTDNRKIKEGDVFVAFIGEKVDAHRFVPAAFEAGAAGAIVSRLPESVPEGKFCAVVEDTLKAYGKIAGHVRDSFGIPVIAVTGSVGKTTMKDMIASVLSAGKNILKTEGNFNNHIGLPATLLRLTAEHEIAVVEMGMNHKGEISYLTGIAKPDMVVITNIGDAHIGNLGSRENIFSAKCEIFEGLRPEGKAFLNGDDVLLRKLRDMPETTKDAKLVYVGESADCDYRAEDIEEHADSISFTIIRHDGAGTERKLNVTVPLPGRHMIYPALTACALADETGLTDEEITAGISGYVPTRMRMEMHVCPGNIIVYNDTYNANPQSVKAGLLTLAGAEGAGGTQLKRVAVLGDMLELGSEEERLHEEVGRFAASLPLDALITVGPAARSIAKACRQDGPGIKVYECGDKRSAMDALRPLITENTAFLCKASRGMALEETAAFIISEAGQFGK